jgi:hypothetical protein
MLFRLLIELRPVPHNGAGVIEPQALFERQAPVPRFYGRPVFHHFEDPRPIGLVDIGQIVLL